MNTSARRMPTRLAIQNHWAERLVEMGKAPSLGDLRVDGPYCFACGINDRPNAPPERAHILARALGGDDSLENLHLLCHLCHKASESLKGDAYWRWFEERTVYDRVLQGAAAGGFNLYAHLIKGRDFG